MAKAKDAAKAKKSKTAKGAKATKAHKLPKTVAGIELPKELREQGAKLLELTKHPLVADIVAAGLVALAGNVRKKAADAQAAPAPAASDAAKPSGMDDLARTASSLASLIAVRAAEKITAKLSGEKPPEAPKAPEAPAAPAAAAPAKKPTAPKKPAPKAAAAKKPAAAKPAAPKPGTKKPAAKPAAKTPAKPRTPRAAKPKISPA